MSTRASRAPPIEESAEASWETAKRKAAELSPRRKSVANVAAAAAPHLKNKDDSQTAGGEEAALEARRLAKLSWTNGVSATLERVLDVANGDMESIEASIRQAFDQLGRGAESAIAALHDAEAGLARAKIATRTSLASKKLEDSRVAAEIKMKRAASVVAAVVEEQDLSLQQERRDRRACRCAVVVGRGRGPQVRSGAELGWPVELAQCHERAEDVDQTVRAIWVKCLVGCARKARDAAIAVHLGGCVGSRPTATSRCC